MGFYSGMHIHWKTQGCPSLFPMAFVVQESFEQWCHMRCKWFHCFHVMLWWPVVLFGPPGWEGPGRVQGWRFMYNITSRLIWANTSGYVNRIIDGFCIWYWWIFIWAQSIAFRIRSLLNGFERKFLGYTKNSSTKIKFLRNFILH